MGTLRVGVIGCGSIARYRHLPEYAGHTSVEIVAVCDIVAERAEEMAEKYGAVAYTNYEDIVGRDDIDAISVCLPNYLHAPVSIAALQAGKHVLCEKPMATSASEAEAMIQAAEANGKFLMIGHNQRLAPAHVKAKEILKSGALGRVITFQTKFGHGGPEGWSIEGAGGWFFQKDKAFVGAMGDLGVHKADLIRYILDDEVVEVGAFVETLAKENTDVDDNAVCVFKMQSGAIGTMTASWTYKPKEDNSTVLYCEKGRIRVYEDPEFPLIVDHVGGGQELHKIGAMQTNESGGQTSTGVIDAFVGSVLGNTKPAISGEEGYQSLKVILAALESAATSQIVKVK